jgi:ATP-dependent RNA helicase RhlE
MTSETQRFTGTVKWYNRKRGFGYIIPDGGSEEIFLHHSALERAYQQTIDEGDRISFGVEQRRKGPSALDVAPLNGNGAVSAPAPATAARPAGDGAAFSNLNLNDNLLHAVRDAGYQEPTPIQVQAIPFALAGRDVMGCAQTGTGKTAAFALPILQRLGSAHQGSNGKKKRRARALVVSPTRELAIQISDSFRTYGRHTGLTNAVIYGGVGQNAQVKAVRAGVDILVATPGRLLDLMGQGHISLSDIEVLVLDEADRMLDMGFIHDIRRIVKAMPGKRQTMLFSATLPHEIVDLAGSILHNPVEVSVSPEQPTVEAIEQAVYFVPKTKKQALLEDLIQDSTVTRALVFTRTKHGADRVVRKLQKRGVQAEPIHGNKSQNARQRALKNFRAGKTRVLVATDVASRGIDVDDISHVIQFDLPNEPETYVHRIGRTGRAGAGGVALAFCAEGERDYLRDIERLIQTHVPVVQEHAYRS